MWPLASKGLVLRFWLRVEGKFQSKLWYWWTMDGVPILDKQSCFKVSPQLQTRLPQAPAAIHPDPPSWPESMAWCISLFVFHTGYLGVASFEHPCVPRALRRLDLFQFQRAILQLHRLTLATHLQWQTVTRCFKDDKILGNLPCQAFLHPFL